MEAKWLNSTPNVEELLQFNASDDHYDIDEASQTETISNCIFNESFFEEIHLSPNTNHIIFDRVCFEGEKPEPHQAQRPFQFRFKQPLASVTFKNCLFPVGSFLPYENITWKILSSIVHQTMMIYVGDKGGCKIEGCKIYNFDLRVSSYANLYILNSYFNSVIISPLRGDKESVKPIKTTTWSGLQFDGYVKKELIFHEDAELEEVSIKYDCLDDKIDAFGIIHFKGGTYKNGITIQSKQFSSKREYHVEENGHNTYVRQIEINYNKLSANAVRVHQSALKVLKITGSNLSINNLFGNSLVNTILLNNYMQSEKGLTLLKAVPYGVPGNFPFEKGCLLIQDSIISNDQFYIQRCSLANWKAQFTGSSFKYQSLSSEMPESSSSSEIKNRLDDLNTLLRSSSKDDNLINWSQIKRNQLELVWKLKNDNGGLSKGQCIQWFVQRLNDYGTDWVLPLSILVQINILFAVVACLIVFGPIPEGGLIETTWWLQTISAFAEEFAISFVPTYRFSEHLWPESLFLFVLFQKVINAVLIVQMVSAFRVYFKK